MTQRQTWQGGVCKGMVVDSEEANEALRAAYDPYSSRIEWLEGAREGLTEDEKQQLDEEGMDFFDWLMKGG